ncbi:dihydropteroate synthase [Shimia aestuarii]|uniref:Dihydropteroate synthase n=1 Tax=Shimia aestuarii TaxID=254406 RepID=A0A1I4J339_9RHOB|nr:dihydropteroate synthase [Shimia aestuarii]SFL60647.1 Dihydropteroate synthase [Shimia aestuarii]
MTDYFRALPQTDAARPEGALVLAGGWCWFTHVEHLRRGAPPEVISARDVPEDVLAAMTATRSKLGRVRMDRPQIMGILNVTPDSFSDGGAHVGPARGLAHARVMVDAGASLIDVGGESTRPGAMEVPPEAEIARTAPVIAAISNVLQVPISIDTRKAVVARAALDEGAFLVNDVSGFTFDPALKTLCVERAVPICVMHAQGDPETMQGDPRYDDVLLDVYDFLAAQVSMLTGLGIPRDQILVDPGIGFGKRIEHNLALLARLSLFHSLGCPILLGASRKGFIGKIGNAPEADQRGPGSVAVALEGFAQGAQVVRVHDVAETRQALQLWQAVTTGEYHGA